MPKAAPQEAKLALYEVSVGYAETPETVRWLGTWTGVCESESDACNKALAVAWGSRMDAKGLAPLCTARIKPRYVVAEHWGHIFVGTLENVTRWTYDRVRETLVYAEIKTNGKWSALTKSAMDEITTSIRDNDADNSPAAFDLDEVDLLPGWVTEALKGAADVALVRDCLAEIDSGGFEDRGDELDARLAVAGTSGKRKAKP